MMSYRHGTEAVIDQSCLRRATGSPMAPDSLCHGRSQNLIYIDDQTGSGLARGHFLHALLTIVYPKRAVPVSEIN